MVVLLVEKVEQANLLVEKGLGMGGTFDFVAASPCNKSNRVKRRPFISDEFLCLELSRHGKIVLTIKKVSSRSGVGNLFC